MKAIYLIGFMGSGKSTFGKILAQALQVPFHDLDHEIEKQTGRSIAELFREWGEKRFREYEAIHLREFGDKEEAFVLATGGGTPCYYQSIEWMNAHGHTLFLDLPFEQIRDRIRGTEAARPVLKALNASGSEEKLRELWLERRKIYLQAASILGPERINIDEVIHMLNS